MRARFSNIGDSSGAPRVSLRSRGLRSLSLIGTPSGDGSVLRRPCRAAPQRLQPVRAHSARAITLADGAWSINMTPYGAPRMAVHATVDTTRSHARAPVRDGLRLINA
jgi:hypothetical protein